MIRRRKPEIHSTGLVEPLLPDGDVDLYDGVGTSNDVVIRTPPRTPQHLHQPPSAPSSPSCPQEKARAIALWNRVLSDFLITWVAWLGQAIAGSKVALATVAEALISFVTLQRQRLALPSKPKALPPIELTVVQKQRLTALQQRIPVPYDGNNPEHEKALDALWEAAHQGRPRTADFEAEGWKEMGWQGNHPSSDFRGGGFMSLENLVYFAQKYPTSFQRLMGKVEGRRSEWEYPFAAAGVNITVLLTDLFDLRSDVPGTLAGRAFLKLLEADEHAFEELYCAFFEALDAHWLATKASYMEFNVVLRETKAAFENAICSPTVQAVEQMPQHALLTC